MSHLQEIQSRNIAGYPLSDDDVEILTGALYKRSGHEWNDRASNVYITPCIGLGGKTMQWLALAKENIPAVFPRKIICRLKVHTQFHWNVIEIIQDSPISLRCLQHDTDGYVYPVDPENYAEIQEVFGSEVTCNNLAQREQRYQFSGQQENNCGIICSLIAHDIATGKMPDSQAEPLQEYGGIIDKNIASGKRIRDVISQIINEDDDNIRKVRFCQHKDDPDPNSTFDYQSYLLNKGRFQYDESNDSQRRVYEGLRHDTDTLIALHNIINSQDDMQHWLNCIGNNTRLKEKAKFIFQDDIWQLHRQDFCMRAEWNNVVEYVYNEKFGMPWHRFHLDRHNSDQMTVYRSLMTDENLLNQLYNLLVRHQHDIQKILDDLEKNEGLRKKASVIFCDNNPSKKKADWKLRNNWQNVVIHAHKSKALERVLKQQDQQEELTDNDLHWGDLAASTAVLIMTSLIVPITTILILILLLIFIALCIDYFISIPEMNSIEAHQQGIPASQVSTNNTTEQKKSNHCSTRPDSSEESSKSIDNTSHSHGSTKEQEKTVTTQRQHPEATHKISTTGSFNTSKQKDKVANSDLPSPEEIEHHTQTKQAVDIPATEVNQGRTKIPENHTSPYILGACIAVAIATTCICAMQNDTWGLKFS